MRNHLLASPTTSLLPIVVVLLLQCSIHSFVLPQQHRRLPAALLSALPSPEESAQALSDYMAKAHSEKLKALKEVEEKKNSEIEALKKEVASLKGSGATTTTSPATTTEGTTEEMKEKLISYQRFMAKYIVEAQEQKLQAVEEAKSAVVQQYEAKLLALGSSSSSTSASTVTAASPVTATTNPLYAGRNAQVSAAGKAGKSRWGDEEVKRAGGVAAAAVPVANGAAASVSSATPPPEVIAADHGLRADGGVGGPTLADRVANGANGISTEAPTPTTPKTASPLYAARNAMVAAASKAGKSRWGSMESKRASEVLVVATASPPPTIKMTPEIEAADHGLRADGGVSGPSLAERVNLGAQLLQGN